MNKCFIYLLFFFLPFEYINASHAFTGKFCFNGFGSIAITASDSNTLGFRRDLISKHPVYKKSPEFLTNSLIGAQASFLLNSRFKGHLQFLLKDSDGYRLDDFIHYAYIDFKAFPALSFRLGRNPLDIFLLSDYRNVGFAYLWARPVTEMYCTLFADFYEGAQMTYSTRFNSGMLYIKTYAGRLDVNMALAESNRMAFTYSPLVGISLGYEMNSLKLIAGYQRGEIKDLIPDIAKIGQLWAMIPDDIVPLASYAADYMNLESSYCDYISLGVSYDNNSWIIQSEASQYRFEKALDLTYNSAYISIGYRLGQLTPFIVYSKFYNEIDNVDFKPDMEKLMLLPQEVLGAFADLGALNRDVDGHQDTISLGLRWNIGYNYALKFQFDHSWIKKNQTVLWESHPENQVGSDEQVNVFSISFDFCF